jgi:hypothetical protein
MKKHAEAIAADRRPERRASTYLPGVIATLDGSAECDCTIRDLSDKGARVTLPKGVLLPNEFYLMHVKERTAYRAQAIWRLDASMGVKFISAMPLGAKAPLFLRKAWLRKAVG